MSLPPPFPLAWPDDWARADPRFRDSTRYRMTMQRAAAELEREMQAWNKVAWWPRGTPWPFDKARAFIITSNVRGTYANGKPFAKSREVRGDPGVAVWWLESTFGVESEITTLNVVACDTWSTVAGNMRACGVVIESLRAMERAKASEATRRATWGFKAPKLPSTGGAPGAPARPWWAERLDLDEPYDELSVVRAYKQRVVVEHPDRGGDHEKFLELERARDEGLAYVRAGRGRREAR